MSGVVNIVDYQSVWHASIVVCTDCETTWRAAIHRTELDAAIPCPRCSRPFGMVTHYLEGAQCRRAATASLGLVER